MREGASWLPTGRRPSRLSPRIRTCCRECGPIGCFSAAQCGFWSPRLASVSFLDLGTGLPTAENTHEVAQGIAPQCRIVYVDNDPIVFAHARALLTSARQGMTAYVQADVRETGKILAEAAATLDLGKPVAVMALMILQYVPDSDDPHAIVARLMSVMPAGSYFVASDTARDIDVERVTEGTSRLNQRMVPTQAGIGCKR